MQRQNLINTRKNANLTQAQISDKLNISVRQYQRIEAGTSNGSLEIWLKLKSILNQSIDYLTSQE